MTDKKSQNNPLLDAWMDGQQQFFTAQKKWLDSGSEFAENIEKPESVTKAEEHWSQCEQQYNSWMKTTENWFPSFSSFKSSKDDITAETVKRMLDPSNFLKSGLDEINHAFYKLVDGPEFADIGTFERKFLKTSKDWVEMRNATAEYMAVTSEAWSETFEEYTKDITKNPINDNDSPKELLDRWLKIANIKLIETQRTERFLEAQRNLITSGTRYRLKQREFVESWCESVSIPTRTEVDDLHQTLYQLRREVRTLKRQLAKQSDNSVVTAKGSKTPKTNKSKKPKKSKVTTRKKPDAK